MDIESLEKLLWRGRKNAQCQCLSIYKKPEYFFRTPSCVAHGRYDSAASCAYESFK
jgi:hypothetical protein